ncbi:HoxN/HupN/NixA family nickel/cobalt transporter [Streptomyces thermoviolaceus]|uniref:Nickel/cobalt efflux system n=1 Tax=Streptomyces thermoviolaceus subsp. thermoviolaceus TaxID=66860 RepID=A0ABX0Z1N6_STRTL|nr:MULTISPECIES: HoxN/HupN/NixA family nickel/cobalt transporter [Streptomyces]MCM3265919.1 HoxN/HupN/NixA family nickel/cobalt transporter [Streptomyces thermoviolaceus]NJP17190.1 HoxN/HupN/NixA family nickel/cobalt transporter [Streptomyces thermoviolaceus subsp. thermoviolaceus]RSR99005.1 HoxN/HupN/NixA family nickel/cobalt transporter [Streptomyces sp. WAC00469]WTD50931.1 HoxN/HupN/NixA family nickel/cobalt transporter [Streptomyces thermoviolaceus]
MTLPDPARTTPDTRAGTSPGALCWRREDTLRTAGLMGVIAALHVVAFGVLFLLVVPQHHQVGTKAFGIGLGITAYTLGVRHAFDADHIAAIDNTTRKLMADGRRPVSAGFWFALGHSSVVVLMAALVAGGTRLAGTLMNDESRTHQALGVVGTTVSGTFLYLIAALNLVALVGIVRVFRAMRAGTWDERALEAHLDSRGLMNRVLGRLTKSVSRPGQMYPLGFLFGLGFDTATEVTLMVMAGSGAASGLPWYAILCLPLLFAAGMSLFDTLDGMFMNVAYQWAFSHPVRKVYYNLTITGLSIAVAFLIGTIELVGVLHDKLALGDRVTGWIAGLDLDHVGYVVVGLFVAVWAVALTYWKVAKVEQRWAARPADTR